jgi:hypothetical protein
MSKHQKKHSSERSEADTITVLFKLYEVLMHLCLILHIMNE